MWRPLWNAVWQFLKGHTPGFLLKGDENLSSHIIAVLPAVLLIVTETQKQPPVLQRWTDRHAWTQPQQAQGLPPTLHVCLKTRDKLIDTHGQEAADWRLQPNLTP